ncbi:alpha/beta hydrolase family protein [candidate division KSB1 bacterium]
MKKHAIIKFSIVCLVVLTALSVSAPPALTQSSTPKRPMTVDDFDTFRTVQGQQISANAEWIVFETKPREGDGELTVLNLKNDDTYVIERGSRAQFTDDSRWAAYMILVHEKTDEELEAEKEAQKEAGEEAEKEPEEKNKLEILNLSTGEKFLVDSVQNFSFSDDSKWIAYKLEKPEEPEEEPEAEAEEEQEETAGRRGRDRKTTGTELVLRNLRDGSEERISFVTDYGFPEESKFMYFIVSSETDDDDGVYIKNLERNARAAAIASGKGKYQNITLNEDNDQLFFLTDRDDQDADEPAFALYTWNAGDLSAQKTIDRTTAGFPAGMQIAASGLRWSKESDMIFFDLSEIKEEQEESEEDDEEKSTVVIWHWKDIVLKSQEQARFLGETTGSTHVGSRRETSPAYLAVFHIDGGRIVRLESEEIGSVSFPPNDILALGADNSEYEENRPWLPLYNNYYILDLEDGSRTPVEMETRWRYMWSNTGDYLLQYTEPHWYVYDVKSGAKRNLTQYVDAEFWNTDDDHPNVKNSWGTAGWTENDDGVIIYDKYDAWYFPIREEGETVNVTMGRGRASDITFRYVSTDRDEEFIDTGQPMLFSAFNNTTKADGFFTARFGRDLREIVMLDKNIGNPVKADDADVFMFTMSTSYEYGDIYVSNEQFEDMRKVSDANPDNNGILWGNARLIEYRNMDGVPLQAILTLPENYVEGEKYPMIIYFYEKLTRNLHSYSLPSTGSGFPTNHFVSNGYVVLQPDIIYTDGFPGPSAVKCVVPVAQKVIDMGIADPEAIAITGHSWGGYQTAYIVTQTDMFACGYAGAPVSNMTSAYGGIRWGTGNPRTFQYETGQSRIGGSLWQYPERYIENSPLFFTDRVNTPLLLLHGDEDTAVPWYQSIEYFMALRRLDKPAWFLQYGGEPHGLRGDANRKDFTFRRMEFFDHYLKGKPMPDWMKEGTHVTDDPTKK